MASERSNLINRSTEGLHYPSLYEDYLRPVLAEFFGVTLFVCVGCLCVLQSGNAGTLGYSTAFSAIAIAAGHGLTIALLVVALGEISGAHLNPAVTVGAFIAGAISPVKAVLYVLAQIVGGLAGAGLTRGILNKDVYTAIGGGAHTLGEGVTAGQGVLCEVVLTTVLVLTVLMTAVDPRNKSQLAPLAIGFAVTVDILAGVQITGASMNPARSFGPAVVISYATTSFWTYHYIYWVGPLLGSLVAGIWYRLFLASSENRLVFKGE
ncbi:aquaporin-8-like [Littorina saxatilis]|uniref:aquaporin-8-like n=1 Tax=Littorina saxatilis TaxID=31220 RepID=UPI0038B509B5